MRPTLISLALAALLVLAPPARPHPRAGGPDEQEARALAAAHSVNVVPDAGGRRDEEFHVYKLEGETLEEAAFGLPAGSLLIRARIYPYEMAVARLGGRLTILAVYPDLDGD